MEGGGERGGEGGGKGGGEAGEIKGGDGGEGGVMHTYVPFALVTINTRTLHFNY